MRAPTNPFDDPSHLDAMKRNTINTNSGNLLFPYAISRALMIYGIEIDYTPFNRAMTSEEIEYANENYDAFIIPLANAFRRSFEKSLIFMTDALKKLTIPCIVIGVGYQGSLNCNFDKTNPFDKSVKKFCDIVLEKSACIGVRGETTAAYLRSLGYREDEHFMVIGCPSLFLHGGDLPAPKSLFLSEKSRIHINFKLNLPRKIYKYMFEVVENIPNYYYIPQNHYELQTIYCGRNVLNAYFSIFHRKVKAPDYFPFDMRHRFYQENRVRGFVNVGDWIDFQRKADLSFGTRIHGNISGILAGIPTYVVAPDSRVHELVRYHNIPHTTIPELDESKNIFQLLEGTDFYSVQRGHKERFDRYVSFMNKNSIDTIFNYDIQDNSLFDRKIREVNSSGPIIPFIHAEREEQVDALEYLDWLISGYEEDLVKSRNEISKMKSDLATAKSQISIVRRSARRIKRLLRGREGQHI